MHKIKQLYRKATNFLQAKFSLEDELKKGQELTKQLRFDEARKVYQSIISRYPTMPQGYEGIAEIESRAWNRSASAKWLKLSIEKTNSHSSYRKYARLLTRHAQYQKGLKVADEMINVDGKTDHNFRLKVELLFFAKRYDEAIGILKILNQNKKTLFFTARALIGAKRYEEADEIIEQLWKWGEKFTKQEKDHFKLLTCWQKYHRQGADFDQPKIFGIGLSRTGTTSLTTALEMLGFTALHFINPLTKQLIDIEDFRYYDAFCDSTVSFQFEKIYELFPNARFIYTERNLPDWIRSSENLYKPFGVSTTKEFNRWLNKKKASDFSKFYHNLDPIYRKAYQNLYADFSDWATAYHAFEERVNGFFGNKPSEKLFRINICDKPEWSELCAFLEVPVPSIPFPYSNTVAARAKAEPKVRQGNH